MNTEKTKTIFDDFKIVKNYRTEIELSDVSTRLLKEIDLSQSGSVIEIFSAVGIFGLMASRKSPDTEVYEYVSNLQDYDSIDRNFKNNGINNGHVSPITNLLSSDKKVDIIVVKTKLEKRKSLIIKSAVQAAVNLKEDGRLFLVGSKDEGIKSIAKQLSKVFSTEPETVVFKKGIHLIKFSFPNSFLGNPEDTNENTYGTITISDFPIKLIEEENVFAKGKLDSATKLLLENLRIEDGNRVLDLGCGAGIIGVVASQKAKNVVVTFVDNDYLSIDTTNKNIKLNNIQNSKVFVSNGISTIRNEKYDVVITNPPFHQGRGISLDTTEQFISEGSSVLSRSGRMYVVCNVFLPYEKTMKHVIGNFEIITKDKSFKVILGVKE